MCSNTPGCMVAFSLKTHPKTWDCSLHSCMMSCAHGIFHTTGSLAHVEAISACCVSSEHHLTALCFGCQMMEYPSWCPSGLRYCISLYGYVKLCCLGCLPGHMPVACFFNHQIFMFYHILSHHSQGHRYASQRNRQRWYRVEHSAKVRCSEHMTPWGCLDTSGLPLVPPHSPLC